MTKVGFEPTLAVGERPQTYTLDRASTDRPVRYIYIYIYQ